MAFDGEDVRTIRNVEAAGLVLQSSVFVAYYLMT